MRLLRSDACIGPRRRAALLWLAAAFLLGCASLPPRRSPAARDAPTTADAPCAVHRGRSMLFGAVGGALAGWLTYQLLYGAWGEGTHGSRVLRTGAIAAGAALGAALAWRDGDPLLPARCRPAR